MFSFLSNPSNIKYANFWMNSVVIIKPLIISIETDFFQITEISYEINSNTSSVFLQNKGKRLHVNVFKLENRRKGKSSTCRGNHKAYEGIRTFRRMLKNIKEAKVLLIYVLEQNKVNLYGKIQKETKTETMHQMVRW